VEEPGSVGTRDLAAVNGRCCRDCGCSSENLELKVQVCITGAGRRTLAVREAIACQKATGSWIRMTRDLHDTVPILGDSDTGSEQVEPASLMVTNVALLQQPPQTGIASINSKGLSRTPGIAGAERLVADMCGTPRHTSA
jgi:hypothetical protein